MCSVYTNKVYGFTHSTCQFSKRLQACILYTDVSNTTTLWYCVLLTLSQAETTPDTVGDNSVDVDDRTHLNP